MSIRLERTQSILKELLIEALSQLDDSRINGANITEVLCSKGKYNARVFIQTDAQDKNEVLKALRKAQGILKEYVLSNSGWYKCPDFDFIIDEGLERARGLDEIFRQIASESGK
ncbi:ribosome-binding factor A [Helicobacter sp. CLO-3]|uniref:30S ribosome-binding factor RbfA n=1 Tax=unclassified Helicobacter TaxID=2593540 RepID=UPI000805AEA1|nr:MULTISPECIES: 30S ribosome-binding factor RbfA [unclassified Helicobacter]OBV28572.1 ribosome-binding factor A [Helicobacter sp. CLO-3]OHU81162.1 ribosome-binding factor A [Helicobacter sp. CLO-3]